MHPSEGRWQISGVGAGPACSLVLHSSSFVMSSPLLLKRRLQFYEWRVQVTAAPAGSEELVCLTIIPLFATASLYPSTPLEHLFCGDAAPLVRRIDRALALLDPRDHHEAVQHEFSFKNMVLGILVADDAADEYSIKSEVIVPQLDGSDGYADLIITHTNAAGTSSAVVVMELKYAATHYCLTSTHTSRLLKDADLSKIEDRNKEIQRAAVYDTLDTLIVDHSGFDSRDPFKAVPRFTVRTLSNQAYTKYAKQHRRHDGAPHNGQLLLPAPAGDIAGDPRPLNQQGNWVFALYGHAVVCSWAAMRYVPSGRSDLPYRPFNSGSREVWMAGRKHLTPEGVEVTRREQGLKEQDLKAQSPAASAASWAAPPGYLYTSPVKKPVQCFKCKRSGHYANTCPSRSHGSRF